MIRSLVVISAAACLFVLASCSKTEPSLQADSKASATVAEEGSPRAAAAGTPDAPSQQRVAVGELRDDFNEATTSKDNPHVAAQTASSSALKIFEQRILPIFRAPRPSSCTECHLSGVDLKNYILPDQEKTFASLVNAGLIDVEQPDNSKILEFIRRKPEKPNLITDKVRKQEYDAFRAWIRAAVNEPALAAAESNDKTGPSLPVAVIRHARRDRVLASFIDNIWSEAARCSGCHSPDQNQKQVKEHGKHISWIKLRDPQATMVHLIEAGLVDTQSPDESLLLLKPTMQVEHGGGQKMMIGDRSYRQFRRFIADYAAIVADNYKSADDLPVQSDEVSAATSMARGVWLKLENVPAAYDQKLLQVDLYRREGDGWSSSRWATADRAVAGDRRLWQQTLSLTAARGSQRAKQIRRDGQLPPGEYLVKVYVDAAGRLGKGSPTGLGEEEFVGEIIVDSQWPKGYGKMTVARFPDR